MKYLNLVYDGSTNWHRCGLQQKIANGMKRDFQFISVKLFAKKATIFLPFGVSLKDPFQGKQYVVNFTIMLLQFMHSALHRLTDFLGDG